MGKVVETKLDKLIKDLDDKTKEGVKAEFKAEMKQKMKKKVKKKVKKELRARRRRFFRRIVILGLLAGGGYYLYKHSDKVKTTVDDLKNKALTYKDQFVAKL